MHSGLESDVAKVFEQVLREMDTAYLAWHARAAAAAGK